MQREFDAQIRKVGNSFVVTIPSITIKRFKLKPCQFLTTTIISKKTKEFDSQIRKVGNSHVTTIPSSIINRFNLHQGDFVTLNISNE